ncbi:MAG: hypothetical protein OHK0053_03570 [Microscillaceae bacterium]
MFKFLFTLAHYQKIYDALEDTEISLKDIDEIILKENEGIIEGDEDAELTSD